MQMGTWNHEDKSRGNKTTNTGRLPRIPPPFNPSKWKVFISNNTLRHPFGYCLQLQTIHSFTLLFTLFQYDPSCVYFHLSSHWILRLIHNGTPLLLWISLPSPQFFTITPPLKKETTTKKTLNEPPCLPCPDLHLCSRMMLEKNKIVDMLASL